MLKTIFCKVYIIFILYSSVAFASNISVSALGDKIMYQSKQSILDAMTTTNWSFINNPFGAYSFQVGQLSNGLGVNDIVLVSESGERVPFIIDITGIVYGGISTIFDRVPSKIGGNIASVMISDSEVISSGESGDYSKFTYISTGNITSIFKLVKPVFRFNTNQLLAKMVELKSPSGIYRASIPLTYNYRVKYSKSSPWAYEVRTFNLNIEVDYTSIFLSQIKVVRGGGVITPVYSKNTTEVSGSTNYLIKADGFMPKGISMSFVDPSREFSMVDKNGNKIKYNINCINTETGVCQNTKLVVDGSLLSQNDIIITPNNGSASSFSFEIEANFSSGFKPSGHYSDIFVVMFEVVI